MSVADKLDRVLTRVEELKHLLASAEGGQDGGQAGGEQAAGEKAPEGPRTIVCERARPKARGPRRRR